MLVLPGGVERGMDEGKREGRGWEFFPFLLLFWYTFWIFLTLLPTLFLFASSAKPWATVRCCCMPFYSYTAVLVEGRLTYECTKLFSAIDRQDQLGR